MEKTETIAALAALAQESRLEIFRLLVLAGSEGRAAGHVAERLGLPSATLSFHLNQLRQAGLVSFRREGRSLIYSADFAAMNGLMGYLTENCCAGHQTKESPMTQSSSHAPDEGHPPAEPTPESCCTSTTPQGVCCPPKPDLPAGAPCCGNGGDTQA